MQPIRKNEYVHSYIPTPSWRKLRIRFFHKITNYKVHDGRDILTILSKFLAVQHSRIIFFVSRIHFSLVFLSNFITKFRSSNKLFLRAIECMFVIRLFRLLLFLATKFKNFLLTRYIFFLTSSEHTLTSGIIPVKQIHKIT